MDFPAKWYADDNKKRTSKDKKPKPHWEVKHRLPTQMRSSSREKTYNYFCPKLCMQTKSGSYGNKTFDGRKCHACGYEKKSEGTEYRSEEVFAYETIVEYATQMLKTKPVIKMQYELRNLNEVDGLKVDYCCPDIVILEPTKVAIRLNGQIHENRQRRIKDEDQRIVLEGNGWIVLDFWFYDMPNLYDSLKTKKKTQDAVFEVLKGMKPIFNTWKNLE